MRVLWILCLCVFAVISGVGWLSSLMAAMVLFSQGDYLRGIFLSLISVCFYYGVKAIKDWIDSQ